MQYFIEIFTPTKFHEISHHYTQLHKDEEFAIDFTYNIKKLLLTVVTLVSPLILTLVMTTINVDQF